MLVATTDSTGAIHNPDGLDVNELIELKQQGKSVTDYPNGTSIDRDAIIDIECDIWIPAARPDVIHEDNVQRLNTKLVIEGANIPITHGAEKALADKGILCVPDFIANAGGLIMAAMEYRQKSAEEAFVAIERKIQKNTDKILHKAEKENLLPRIAAEQLAVERVKAAMSMRNLSYQWK